MSPDEDAIWKIRGFSAGFAVWHIGKFKNTPRFCQQRRRPANGKVAKTEVQQIPRPWWIT